MFLGPPSPGVLQGVGKQPGLPGSLPSSRSAALAGWSINEPVSVQMSSLILIPISFWRWQSSAPPSPSCRTQPRCHPVPPPPGDAAELLHVGISSAAPLGFGVRDAPGALVPLRDAAQGCPARAVTDPSSVSGTAGAPCFAAAVCRCQGQSD